MAGNKRTLDSFVTVTKKTCITSPSEQTEVDDSDLNTINTDQVNNVNLDQANEINSTNIDQNLTVIDSHPETHDNDIGYQLSQHNPPNDEIKYLLVTKPFRPDNKYIFPNQPGKNGTVRRFMAAWLTQYSFLSYSPYYEGAFCSACALFSPLVSSQSLVIFVHYPCCRFEQLKHFVTNIKFHLNSKNHKTAVERATNFIRTSENLSSSINYQIDRNRIEAIEKNKAILLSIIKVVITCARQNIALRGH
ncbi:unnamed protein product [Rotaria sp. Silwood2]|nr:unnamed protein product [Rotaria sp. Silwood2]CAF4183890.1 unnamed protein product [Rotaria sp. Silwood2]